MSSMFRRAMVRVMIPLSWRVSPGRVAVSLRRFADVEADSCWQMLAAMGGVDDPAFRGELFNNALEEVHHAALFGGLARRYAAWPLPVTTEPRQRLFEDCRRDLRRFEAWHYVGELDVYSQFESYARASHLADVRQTFVEIRGDEEEHQRLAWAKLVEMSGSRGRAMRLVARVRLRRAYESWKRCGEAMGNVVSSVVHSAIYFTVGLVVAPLCRRRLAGREPVVNPSEFTAEPQRSTEGHKVGY